MAAKKSEPAKVGPHPVKPASSGARSRGRVGDLRRRQTPEWNKSLVSIYPFKRAPAKVRI